MHEKKFLSLAVLFITILALCASCTTTPTTMTTTGTTTTASGTTTSGSPEMLGNMYLTGHPIVKDKVTLKMVASKRAFSAEYDGMQLLEDLEAKTNVHIEWELIPQAQYAERKSLLFVGNELPDAFFGQTSLTASDIATYGPQGVLIDMTDLIDKYAPYYKAICEENELFEKVSISPDGKIYGLSRAKQVGYNDAPDQMYIYKPWLEKLKLNVPTTLDEFHTVLTAFATQDPNGNGKADEIPFTFRYKTHYQSMYSLFGSFGICDNVLSEDLAHMTIVDGKVVYVPIQEHYKQAIAYFHTYFKEGLIDEESFTQDLTQYTAKGATEDVTVGSFVSWNDFDVAGADRASDYVIVPPMAGPNGDRMWNRYMHDNNGIVGNGFSITSVNQYPEITMRWVDEFYEPEFSIQVQNGPVGVNLKVDANGNYTFLPTPDGMTFDEFVWSESPVDAPGAVFAEVLLSGKLAMGEVQARKTNYVEQYYRQYMTSETFNGGVKFTTQETTEIATIKTDIYNYVNDMQAEWLLNGGIESQWDEYLTKLQNMKLDRLVELYQIAYDRFIG